MKNKNVLKIDSDGLCEVSRLSAMSLMAIDAGQFSKVGDAGQILGWGPDFDGKSKEEWRIDNCAWTFVMPTWASTPRDLI